MNLLSKLFGKKKEKKNPLQVYEIVRDTDNVVEALGMTEERAEKLTTICERYMAIADNVVEVMEKVSKDCFHPNELYYVSMVITIMHEKMKEPTLVQLILRRDDPDGDPEDN